MKEVKLEISIHEPVTYDHFKALEVFDAVELLRITSAGMTFLCCGSDVQVKGFSKSINSQEVNISKVEYLQRDKSGFNTLLIHILWLGLQGELYEDHKEDISFFKEMENASLFPVGKPTFERGKLKIALIGYESTVERLLDGLTRLDTPYKVLYMGAPRIGSHSPLDKLSPRQLEIIHLAYRLGYYEIPRKIRTRELAGILDIDKGTLGDHIRRAERHIFDELMNK